MSPRKCSSGKSNVQPISANDSGTSLKLFTPYGRTDTIQWMPDSHGKKCVCDPCWGIPRKERKRKVLEEDEDIIIVSKRESNQKRLNYDASDEDVHDDSNMDTPDTDGYSPIRRSRSVVGSTRRTSPRLNGKTTKRKRFSIDSSDEEEVPSKKKVRSPRVQQNREMDKKKKGSSPNRTNDAKPQEQELNEEQRVHKLIGTMSNFMQYVENEISKEPEEEQKKDMQRYVVKMKQLMTAAHNLASQC